MHHFFFFLLLLINVAFAQENKSIHQVEWEKHRHLKKGNEHIDALSEKIIPLKKNQSKALSKKVFGFLPDWEYLAGAMNNLRFDLLTHIAAFDFEVSSTGSISNPSGWPWTDLINEAHFNGVKVILTAVNFDGDKINTIISDETVKNNFFTNLKNKISLYQLDGVNIDFESLNYEDRAAPINNFMADLTEFMHTNFPESEVSFDGPAVNWGNRWDLAGLANSCDYIFIMGYAFVGKWSDNSGSTAPLTGGSFNITNTVLSQYSSVVNSTPQKLILGVPYYGVKFQTQNSQAHSEITQFIGSTRFRDDKSAYEDYGTLWDAVSSSPWYRYQSNGKWYQVWSDNGQSIDEKFDLADAKNLAGVGMWALNYDGNQVEFWNIINDHYGDENTTIKNEKFVSPETFYLLPNIPNPFNPQTTIQFYSPKSGKAKIIVFDINGKKVIESDKIDFMPGIQSWVWNGQNSFGKNVGSGTYFYKVILTMNSNNQKSLHGKMTIIR